MREGTHSNAILSSPVLYMQTQTQMQTLTITIIHNMSLNHSYAHIHNHKTYSYMVQMLDKLAKLTWCKCMMVSKQMDGHRGRITRIRAGSRPHINHLNALEYGVNGS